MLKYSVKRTCGGSPFCALYNLKGLIEEIILSLRGNALRKYELSIGLLSACFCFFLCPFSPSLSISLCINNIIFSMPCLISYYHYLSVSFFCSRETYNALTNWLTDARTLASPNIVIVLVGNKKDLESDREVTFMEASRFAQENGMVGGFSFSLSFSFLLLTFFLIFLVFFSCLLPSLLLIMFDVSLFIRTCIS